jgi:hypothetical protein
MTYFLLTDKAWYLMQGGTDLCLDKANLTQVPGSNRSKITLPKQWFYEGQSTQENKFLPKTLQIKLNDPGIQPFREPQVGVLSVFSVPVNKVDFEALTKIKNLPELLTGTPGILGIYSLASRLPRSFNAPYLDYVFFPKNYESQKLIFPQIIFTEDISKDNFKKGFNDPSLGEILLWVTWLMGLTPRPRIIRESRQQGYQRYLLDFIVRPQPDLASQPTTMATLEEAFKTFSYEYSEQPTKLVKVLQFIKDETSIQVNVLPSLSNQSITLTFLHAITFTEVMDAIANFLQATWDWQNEDSVFLISLKTI